MIWYLTKSKRDKARSELKGRRKESANKGMGDYVGKGGPRKCSRGGGLTEGRERTQAVPVS